MFKKKQKTVKTLSFKNVQEGFPPHLVFNLMVSISTDPVRSYYVLQMLLFIQNAYIEAVSAHTLIRDFEYAY